MRASILLALAVVLGLTTPGAAAPDAAVEVRLFQFRPGPLEVERGTRVTWTNQDEIGHTVTAGTPEAPAPAGFDLKLTDKGARASTEFGTPGSYPYFCRRHNAMRGEIRVK
jgi:plastocyanin